MEGKPYRGIRGVAKNRKKKFYEAPDKLRELLCKLAKLGSRLRFTAHRIRGGRTSGCDH